MCDWCSNPEGATYCQDCGRQICKDDVGHGDFMSAPYVTSYGDLYCWGCGIREQRDIDRVEEEESDEWGFMEYDEDDWQDDA